MRYLTMCALSALAFGAAANVDAQTRASDTAIRQPSLFISPMGEPFRANAAGARGIDLWFTEADANYDTRISHDEFIANANAFFPHVDANQDGALTSVEDTAYWQRTAPELVNGYAGGEPIGNTMLPDEHQRERGVTMSRQTDVTVQGPRRGGGQVERPVGAQAYGLLGDAEPIMSCDANFDRRVTLAEFDACAERRFAMLDLNHDGFITPDEVNQFRRTGGDVVHISR
jgi:EF hand domain-containing protein